jgi:hypothetical protein
VGLLVFREIYEGELDGSSWLEKINTEIASGRLSCWRLAELAASSEEAKEETDKR